MRVPIHPSRSATKPGGGVEDTASYTGPPVERVVAIIPTLFSGRPLLASQLTDRLRQELPGVSCDVYAEAITTLLRVGRITISNSRYTLGDTHDEN